MAIPWLWRHSAPSLDRSMHAFTSGSRGDTATSVRSAIREGWTPAIEDAADAAAVARFVAAAAADLPFLQGLGGGFSRLADLARAAGAQREMAQALLPHAGDVVRKRPQLLAPVLGLLSGAVPVSSVAGLDAPASAMAAAGGGTAPPDPLVDAILSGERDTVEEMVADLCAGEGVAAAVERLRPWTPLLAPLELGIARDLPPSYDAIRLALVLDERVALAAVRTDDPELAAAAAWARGDRSALAALYARWAAAGGVVARSWTGDTLAALMAEFSQPGGPPSRDPRLVSVVMTAADPDPALMRLAIESLIAQTHPRWELLLIDDGSADPAPFAEAAARDPRIRRLATDRNGGPYLARNLALGHAKGAAIAIHDADDVAHPERLRAQLDRLVPGRACVMSRALRFDAATRLQLEGDGAVIGAGTMTTLFDARVFDTIGPFAPVRSRGDVEFLDRIARTLGPDHIATTACPLMLANAAPDTLSHRTRRAQTGALRLFRRGYTLRRWWREGPRWIGAGTLTVPWGLTP